MKSTFIKGFIFKKFLKNPKEKWLGSFKPLDFGFGCHDQILGVISNFQLFITEKLSVTSGLICLLRTIYYRQGHSGINIERPNWLANP